MLPISRLSTDAIALFDQHFARHRAESGRDGFHFMPFAPDDDEGPRGLDAKLFELTLDTPGWQRWWVARTSHNGDIVGHVDLKGNHLKTGMHRCELGIGIEHAYRGQGMGRRLMQTAIDFARSAPTLKWLDLRVFADNKNARLLYTKLGFAELGVVVDRFQIDGVSIDDVLMTLDVSSLINRW